MKKIGGYILTLIGLVILASQVKGLEIILKYLPFLSSINKTYSMIAGLMLIVLGIVMLMGSGGRGRQLEEVPIYRGKNIVGYRRQR